jgi:2-polyprenyl-6-hydroxyphenyl methylase/3-demethylubiquinone-9 3-methyltransferase
VATHSDNAVTFHSRQAAEWEAGYSKREFSVRFAILEDLLKAFNLTGQYWLDAGCGTGTLSRWLAEKKGCRVLGVDASSEMIANCSRVRGTEFKVVDDIYKLPFPDSAFDGVLCSSVLEYLDSPENALQEFCRVTRKGGLLLASVPNSHFLTRLPVLTLYWLTKSLGRFRQFSFLDHSEWAYSVESFSELIHRCGFVPSQHRKYGECRFGKFRIEGQGTMIMFLGGRAVEDRLQSGPLSQSAETVVTSAQ